MQHGNAPKLWLIALGTLGVIYGDIGTSPLYTMKETFSGHYHLLVNEANVFGVLSLVFWSIVLLVTLKYVFFIMNADNQGEGGIMALISLCQRITAQESRLRWWLTSLGILGAALFYGDCIITPAISVLSAVEGLNVVAPQLGNFIVPIAAGILIALFLIQRFGTAGITKFFTPIMLCWFMTLAGLGIVNLWGHWEVLAALNPIYGIKFFMNNQLMGLLALGSIVLAVTGGEALYADMGHFGKRSIRWAWMIMVFPSLLLNYFGQGALILGNPKAVANPFFLMAPKAAQLPLVILATLATIIAAQAVISGAFSVTRQAVRLGFWPRIPIKHTSAAEIGQIYIPIVNWLLLLGVVALVFSFRSSSNLAAAYGIAVVTAMTIDTLLVAVVAYLLWKWPLWRAILVITPLLFLDSTYLLANAAKIIHGGWLPLVVGAFIFTLMTTWKRGRQVLADRLRLYSRPLKKFLVDIFEHPAHRVPGAAVYLTSNPELVPHALLRNYKHNHILHERVVILSVNTENHPHVSPESRVKTAYVGSDVYRVSVRYGYMDEIDLPRVLKACQSEGLSFPFATTTYFLSRETLIASPLPGMATWRETLFAFMSNTAESAMTYFKLPTERVLEIGAQVKL